MTNSIAAHKLSRLAGSGINNWKRWAIANLVGGILGWTLTAITMTTTLGISIVLAWLMVGLCVATAQYYVISEHLRCLLPPRKPAAFALFWTASTIVGTLIGLLLCFFCRHEIPDQLYRMLAAYYRELGLSEEVKLLINTLLGSASGGLIYGALQGLALRSPKAFAAWCILCALGWSIGASIGIQTAEITISWLQGYSFQLASGYAIGPYDALYFAISGITGTFIFGIITGIFVSRLPSHFPDTQDTLQTAQSDPG